MISFRINGYLYTVFNGIATKQLVRGEINTAPEQCKQIDWYYPNEPTSRILAEAIHDSGVLGSREERFLLEIFGEKRANYIKTHDWVLDRRNEYNRISVETAHKEAKQR